MNDLKIQSALLDYMIANSNLDQKRPYLGMSQIGRCARYQYNCLLNGIETNIGAHKASFRGYYFEAILRDILIKKGIYKPDSQREIIAFDGRFKGHTDGETVDGHLLEFKSMSHSRFESVIHKGLPQHIIDQMQCYMCVDSRYKLGFCVIIDTETFTTRVIPVSLDGNRAFLLLEKAHIILDCYDKRTPPDCECGHCMKGTI